MAEEGAVAVCVRVRPLNSREEALGEESQVYWKTDNNAIYQVDGSKSFNFDRVFHSNETTKNVYEEIAVPIIDSAIQGYNGTIFAYGQTASGKTYTMMGSKDYLGVIPRAIHDIFQKIKKFPEREFLLRVSYMEIYNETITDLLCDTQKMKPLIIREDFNRNVYVSDLTEEVVYTSEMALKWITKGEKNRHYGITKMNQRSSRSHTIFRMILESREKGEPSNCDGSVKVSHLNLVDLAGSERAAQTGAEGMRLKEGCNINRSLFILGQVIKKLSDGQVGGFINYRDSKLTRILQNSLGGNAKTRIICTITPVSYDETLTTLQFASTAKYMKNTPYVNEVSSDEALLKRYRKEIMDLKKQLEEVSLETRAQAMEKDQLAQLLEEKDLLQKVQIEKIENLTRMLVTSSSLTSQQESKAKKKRRVTWCLGKINKMKDSNYVNEFNVPANVTTKSQRATLAVLGEIDESLCSEPDVLSNTLDTLTEVEWNPATKLLNQENLESELSSLRANYDNLVLDYEQLRRENEEMELKLKEKNDLDEFEALERKAEKDQEMQLIHEISNLKNLVKHAEVYNQDLESELSSKVEMLKEKEEQIKKLQKHIDSRQSENTRMDLSHSSDNTDDLKQMKQTLLDVETVALDSKRESAFLRSENLELKEKMKELAGICSQMEKDIHTYQRQLETKKKMQVDLEKELQSSYNEITKLNSLMDGKIPKDLLCNLELERKIADLQKELSKEGEENEALRNEIKMLSELKLLPSEIEMLRKEILDKSEELSTVMSEKDHLLSEVVHKERRIQDLLEEAGKAKGVLATTQTDHKGTDQDGQDFQNHRIEFEQKYQMVLEENVRLNQEIGNLSKEAENLGFSLAALKTELSHKTQELQQKTTESQERLSGMEQLKARLESSDSRLQTVEMERTVATEKLQQTLEDVRALTQEKDELRQLQERLQAERDQLRSDIEDTVHMNIETQEQLRDALESLKQHQETISTLKMKISADASRDLPRGESTEAEGEFQGKASGVETQSVEAGTAHMLTADVEDREQQRKILSLAQEKEELQQVLERVTAEKEQLEADLRDSVEMTIENQEELRILRGELKKQQEIVTQEKDHTALKDELSRSREKLLEAEEKLKEKSQQLEEKQQQLLIVQEEMSEMQKKVNDMENLKNELKNQELTLERMEMERLDLAQKLHENYEEMKSLTKERNDLKELQDSFETEREKLKEYIREMELTGLETKEELKIAHIQLKEHQETIDELRNTIEKTSQGMTVQKDLEKSSTELQCKTPGPPEKQELPAGMSEDRQAQETVDERAPREEPPRPESPAALTGAEVSPPPPTGKQRESPRGRASPTEGRDTLGRTGEAPQAEWEQLDAATRGAAAHVQESQEKQEQSFNMEEKYSETKKMMSEERELEAQFRVKDSARPELRTGRLCSPQGQQDALQAESDRLRENLGEITAKHEEAEKDLRTARHHLQEHEETIHQLQAALRERETELSRVQKELEAAHNELQKKIQELLENQKQLTTIQETSEAQGSVRSVEQLQELLKARDASLQRVDGERLALMERLQERQEELRVVTEERDALKGLQEALQRERDLLEDSAEETEAKGQKIKEELETRTLLPESQETMGAESPSEETDRGAGTQGDLDAASQGATQERPPAGAAVVSEARAAACEVERLAQRCEAQASALEDAETENARLAQRLYEHVEEMKSVCKERDDLRSLQETLRAERDQLQAAVHRDLETQEELETARVRLGEQQETIEKLQGMVSAKTDEISSIQMDLENTNSVLKSQVQELREKERQLLEVKHHLSENTYQTEQLRKELEAQSSALGGLEAEKSRLTQKLTEMDAIVLERDGLRRAEGALQTEREQLRQRLQVAEAKDLETQEELEAARGRLREQRETIDKLRGLVSEKTGEIASMLVDLENTNTKLQEKIQELKANEQQLLKLKEDVSETQRKMPDMERLKAQLKAQSLTLDKLEMENLNLAQKLHENLEETKSVMRERDRLRRAEETLSLERDQLRGELQGALARDQETQGELKTARVHLKEHQETIDELRERLSEKTTQISYIQKDLNKAKDELQKKQDQQNHQAVVKCGKTSVCDGKRLTENLREKCCRIKALLKKYSEVDNHYECLSRLSLPLEKEIETQKELSARIKASLLPPSAQTKEIQKLLTANQRCSMEFHRVTKKLKYVLGHITKIKEESHESITKLESAVIDEVEKHSELLAKMQHPQPDCAAPPGEAGGLGESLDLHAEVILSDLAESNFHSINAEFQEVLSNRKEMTQFLQEWLNTPFDTEKLKNGIQRGNNRLCHVNNFYNNKIIAIMNESTEFEERNAVVAKEWEQKLKSMKERNEKLFTNYQTLRIPQTSGALVSPAPQDDEHHVNPRAPQPASERIQELEASLREAKDSAKQKENKITKLQKELEMMSDVIAELQGKVNASNQCLEKTKDMMQALQDKAALGAKPYKEEIEDLKTKLVKTDLEKMKHAKEFEKEMTSVKATVDYQKEVIRVLRENLRRNQQAHDTSMVSEHAEPQPANKPLTCGGGSGIVQSTKALILKSEYVRLEKENAKLKQQNEQLLKQKNELLSNNHHLSSEVRTWKERTLKRDANGEAACENSPKSPKAAAMASRGHRTPSQCRERSGLAPVPQGSPKSWFFDSRAKSFPAPHPVRYFDNSGLGLCPEEQTTGAENVAPPPGAWRTASGADVPECKTQ